MLSFEEALERVLTDVPRVGDERLGLRDSLGRVLARDVIARDPFPPFAASAMDGYAVASSTFAGPGPWRLIVATESRMGRAPEPLVAGAACRIVTGAPVPPGADTVVMQEDVVREGNCVTFARKPSLGTHIRRAGEDLGAGDVALPSGARLGPFQLALAASVDCAELVVSGSPRVTIVCTGDELRSPGEPARPGTIAESNAIGLLPLIERAGGTVRVAPLVGDDLDETIAVIAQSLESSDVLLTVGGVSVGDHDVVRPALERCGVTLAFWKVAIKPGKPVAFGMAGRKRVLSLPGNPASSLVTFALFGMPLLRAMQGDAAPKGAKLRARLATPIARKPGRLEFVRATLDVGEDGLRVTPLANQASGAVTSMGWSNAFAIVPADVASMNAGDMIDVFRVDDA